MAHHVVALSFCLNLVKSLLENIGGITHFGGASLSVKHHLANQYVFLPTIPQGEDIQPKSRSCFLNSWVWPTVRTVLTPPSDLDMGICHPNEHPDTLQGP